MGQIVDYWKFRERYFLNEYTTVKFVDVLNYILSFNELFLKRMVNYSKQLCKSYFESLIIIFTLPHLAIQKIKLCRFQINGTENTLTRFMHFQLIFSKIWPATFSERPLSTSHLIN